MLQSHWNRSRPRSTQWLFSKEAQSNMSHSRCCPATKLLTYLSCCLFIFPYILKNGEGNDRPVKYEKLSVGGFFFMASGLNIHRRSDICGTIVIIQQKIVIWQDLLAAMNRIPLWQSCVNAWTHYTMTIILKLHTNLYPRSQILEHECWTILEYNIQVPILLAIYQKTVILVFWTS